MNYFLFKLQFDTAVHFGGADSALSLYTSEETLRADLSRLKSLFDEVDSYELFSV